MVDRTFELLSKMYAELTEFRKETNSKFDTVETRLGSLENRFDTVETRLGSLENRFDTVETRLGSLENRFDTVEIRLGSLENRFDKLETDFSNLRNNQKKIETILENDIKTKLQALHERAAINSNKLDDHSKQLASINDKLKYLAFTVNSHDKRLEVLETSKI